MSHVPASATPPHDLRAIIRSRQYRVLLLFAAVVGVLVSLASWVFLELQHGIQVGVYDRLPGRLGFDTTPTWWPLPWLALAGVLVAFAVERLPGRGGHEPWRGLGGGFTQPLELPGVVLAALASLGLGAVVGPEAPLVALGTGLAIFAVRRATRGTSDQIVTVIAAAGAFAAISSIFGSPIIGAVLLIEAAGLGGPTLPLVLLPGLMAAGVGALVFVGMGDWTGVSSGDYALSPLVVPSFPTPELADFLWTIPLAIAAAVVVVLVVEIARRSEPVVARRRFVLLPATGLVIGGVAIAFVEITGKSSDLVLFSGQQSFGSLTDQAAPLAESTLVLLLVCKGLAWALSLGNFRGGAVFPALFLGVAAGVLAADLPGLGETPAIAVLMGATCAAMLRLPLSSVIITLLLLSGDVEGAAPLVIVAVAVSYVASQVLDGIRALRFEDGAVVPDPAAATTAT